MEGLKRPYTALSVILIALLLGILACGTPEEVSAPTETTAPVEPSPIESESPAGQQLSQEGAVGPTTAELAQATVMLFAMLEEGGNLVPQWTGSGSVISPEGLILTNAHVVYDPDFQYDALAVALTGRTDEPPQVQYLAEVAALDYNLDLAVVQIRTTLDGGGVEREFPFVSIGDSNSMEIGDKLRILGYPGIGGETITFTEGSVSGFNTERSVEGRAWIKTDATIAGGNSGGMGVNESGELIGVPTRVSSGSEYSQTVDCRPLADTNRDGYIDGQDTCVPVGGFINALRPVNLALPLIEAARAGEEYAGGERPQPPSAQGFDRSQVDFDNLEFSEGVEDDQPLNYWYALPAGTTELCVFWDYSGMVDGLSWAVYWFRDGTYLENGSLPGEVWNGGAQGNWWACIFNDTALEEGLYEVSLEVEGAMTATESIYLGGERSVVELTLINQSAGPLCYVLISPSQAQNWGPDELGSEEIVEAGGSRVFDLATGTYDLRLLDCDAAVLTERFDITVSESISITFP